MFNFSLSRGGNRAVRDDARPGEICPAEPGGIASVSLMVGGGDVSIRAGEESCGCSRSSGEMRSVVPQGVPRLLQHEMPPRHVSDAQRSCLPEERRISPPRHIRSRQTRFFACGLRMTRRSRDALVAGEFGRPLLDESAHALVPVSGGEGGAEARHLGGKPRCRFTGEDERHQAL
jgi:hypothetical protein